MRRKSWRKKEEAEQIDFHYCVDVDYDSGCHGCQCEDICRCGTIDDAWVESTSIPSMTSLVLRTFFPINTSRKNPVPRDTRATNPVFLYCLDRILHRLKPDDFEVETCGGYYGEEISRVLLLDEKPLTALLQMSTPQEWVEHVLTLEYGYVHEDLKGRDWVAEILPTKSVLVPNTYRKLDSATVKLCQAELEIPPYAKKPAVERLSCLCSEDYKLVDGYHRLRASIESKAKNILVVRPRREEEREE